MSRTGEVDGPRSGDALGATIEGPSLGGAATIARPTRALDVTTAQPLRGVREEPQQQHSEALDRGVCVGRYVLIDRIGAGGMGQVFAAYDPELDRKVAIKLVLVGGMHGETRLLREAQALARLAHPNVVAIHDVGVHACSVWIAMEFVAGETVGVWARAAPRRWPELLRVLLDAARGVAAAHAVGLVHRDLKPDNVMLGHDGRVRVMDFGLVHGGGDAPPDEPVIASVRPAGGDASTVQLTRLGDVLGTPAYMAPEQWRGEEVGALADQFGWSVMAWELLYGERPFAGDTCDELRAAVLAGRRRPPPRGRAVPTWLRRVVERGLASEPGQRWPDMTSLALALERGQSRVRRRVVLGSLVVVAGLVGLGLGLQRWQAAQRVAACEAAGAEVSRIWNDEAREGLRAAFAATHVSYGELATERTLARLDAQATAWQAARTEACRVAEIDRSWRADTAARASWCLEDRRLELASLVDTLLTADARIVQSAADAADKLSPVAPCLDAAQLQLGPAPPQAHDEVRDIRAALAHAASLVAVGKYKDAFTAATAVRERADALGWPPLQAEVMGLQGTIHASLHAVADGLQASKDAYRSGARAGAWRVAAEAAMAAMNASTKLGHPEQSHEWGVHAEVAIAHAGDPLDRLEARRLGLLAYAEAHAGANQAALSRMRAALALNEAALGGEQHMTIASNLYGLAYFHYGLRDTDEALALASRALGIAEALLGPTHPDLTRYLKLLSHLHMDRRQSAEALALMQRVLAIDEATYGPTHPGLGETLGGLGGILAATGRYAEATALAERSLKLAEANAEQAPLGLVTALNWLAYIRSDAGDLAAAKRLYERVLVLREAAFGPENPFTLETVLMLARVLTDLGEHTRAKQLYERLLAHTGPGGPFVPLVGYAALALRTHDLAAARDLLARARAHSGDPGVTPDLVAQLHSVSGEWHMDSGAYAAARADFAAALALYEQSLGVDHPSVAIGLVDIADTWLAAGAPQTASPLLERALAISAAHPRSPRTEARMHFVRARALISTDPARALAAASRARDDMRGPGMGEELAEVEAWLARHGRKNK